MRRGDFRTHPLRGFQNIRRKRPAGMDDDLSAHRSFSAQTPGTRRKILATFGNARVGTTDPDDASVEPGAAQVASNNVTRCEPRGVQARDQG
jgi:hypothetical protein